MTAGARPGFKSAAMSTNRTASAISHHAALIYAMVLVSASDADMTDGELKMIGELVSHLPIFRDYESQLITKTAASCAELLSAEEGLKTAFAAMKQALPPKLRETAYALACDVAAADGNAHQEELRVLEMIRHELGIERLIAAAIERAAGARFAVL